jgi:hypothetical protein
VHGTRSVQIVDVAAATREQPRVLESFDGGADELHWRGHSTTTGFEDILTAARASPLQAHLDTRRAEPPMYREMDIRFWLEGAEAAMRES